MSKSNTVENITRQEALLWMIEQPDNIIESDECRNQKHYYRWENDKLWVSYETPSGPWVIPRSASWLHPTYSYEFRPYRKHGICPHCGEKL